MSKGESSETSGLEIGWRQLLFLVLMAALTLVVVTRFANFAQLLQVLSKARWGWVAAAVISHLIYFVADAQLHHICFSAVDVKSRLSHLLPVLLSVIFVNAVVPTGGAGGAAIFVDDAANRGESGARTAVGALLALLVDLGSLIPLVTWSLVFLGSESELRSYYVLGVVFLSIFVIGMIVALYLAHRHTGWLRGLLGFAQRVINTVGGWFGRPHLISNKWVRQNASELSEGAEAIARHRGKLWGAGFYGLLLHVLDLIAVYALFLAFEQPIGLGPLLAGFSLGIVFWVVTIIPQGIGAVEGIMALVFTSFGIPSEKAAAVVLVFRGVNFWLPLLVGFFFLRQVSTFNPGRDPSDSKQSSSGEHQSDLSGGE